MSVKESVKAILYGSENLSPTQEKARKAFMYLCSGGLTTVVNFASFAIFDKLVNAHVNVNIFGWDMDLMVMLNQLIAWLLAVLTAYITNRIFVFRSKGNVLRELLSFGAARVASFLVIELGILYLQLAISDKVFGCPQETILGYIGSFAFTCLYLNKLLNSVIIVFANYFMSKIMVFRKDDCVDLSKAKDDPAQEIEQEALAVSGNGDEEHAG
ncbi:MAG: GtrA family protein [Saccharofermentans sp.]|nr:GtrA family protein [Saccharofermentans sp.]